MSSNTNRQRRTTRSTNSNAPSSSSDSSSRPVRSTRAKVSVHKIDDSSSESDSDDIKPIEKSNLKKKNSTNKADQDRLNKLETLTGLSRSEAARLLETANNNLDQAIELHFSNGVSNNSTSTNGLKRTIKHLEDTNSSDSIYASDDNVRAPIQPKSEKMLDYDPYGKKFFNIKKTIFHKKK